jgi:methylthioribose-1-phosphate isomerase
MRPIDWDDVTGTVRILDQTALPDAETYLSLATVDGLIAAIRRLAVRGAPALGVAGALGVALAARSLPAAEVPAAVARLRAARPTAVNLARGVDTAAAALPAGSDAVLVAALGLRDAEVTASNRMAARGAALLPGRGLRLLTICNTGALAAVERGTALAVIEQVHREGRLERAIACETRPLLQGSRLTAWELQRMGAAFDVIVDGAAASLIGRGLVDAVLVGADRIAMNGDVANKVGTFALALVARHARPAARGGAVPCYVVAPESTVDPATPDGAAIEIEDRGAEEVVALRGVPLAPAATTALNPAFDVTPAGLITAIVTDRRVIWTAAGEHPRDVDFPTPDPLPPNPS